MVAEPDPARTLSRAEFTQLASLLARYADAQLDQWEAWRLTTSHGAVFVDISRELASPHEGRAYTPIWSPTGDAQDAGTSVAVSRDDVPLVVRQICSWAELDAADAAHLFDAPPVPAGAEVFFGRSGHVLLLAFWDGRAVGFVSGVETCHPDKRPEMLMLELGVDEPFRRRGIALALISGLRALAAERGIDATWVVTEPDNTAAGRTYAAAGADGPETTVVFSWDTPPR